MVQFPEHLYYIRQPSGAVHRHGLGFQNVRLTEHTNKYNAKDPTKPAGVSTPMGMKLVTTFNQKRLV